MCGGGGGGVSRPTSRPVQHTAPRHDTPRYEAPRQQPPHQQDVLQLPKKAKPLHHHKTKHDHKKNPWQDVIQHLKDLVKKPPVQTKEPTPPAAQPPVATPPPVQTKEPTPPPAAPPAVSVTPPATTRDPVTAPPPPLPVAPPAAKPAQIYL